MVIHKTRELESVKVKRYPDQKTTFEDGEVSLEGLILTEYYTDGTSEDKLMEVMIRKGVEFIGKMEAGVVYTSSVPKIATVSSKGVIKAKQKGKTVIAVKSGKKIYKIQVTVR